MWLGALLHRKEASGPWKACEYVSEQDTDGRGEEVRWKRKEKKSKQPDVTYPDPRITVEIAACARLLRDGPVRLVELADVVARFDVVAECVF
jgi:hypothetical protein